MAETRVRGTNMNIPTLKICSKDEFESLSNENNIVIQVSMLVNGEIFNDAMVIDNYKGRPVHDVINDIEDKGKRLIRGYACVINGREWCKGR